MLKGHAISFGKGNPFAIRSQLGWLIAGSVSTQEKSSIFHVNNIQLVNDQLVNKFWELDSVPAVNALTSDEIACKDHFKMKHSKDNGSFSHKPLERASCGPGPPLKQLTSCSVENTNSNFVPSQLGQKSVSGNVSSKKTFVGRVDDDALKRSRLQCSQYKLSQVLLDRRVEMLERRYGGVCACEAAITIQCAFRKYTFKKRFQDIANTSKGKKRLTRGFPIFQVEN